MKNFNYITLTMLVVYIILPMIFGIIASVSKYEEDSTFIYGYNNLIKILFPVFGLAVAVTIIGKRLFNGKTYLSNLIAGDFTIKFKFKVGDIIVSKEDKAYVKQIAELDYYNKCYNTIPLASGTSSATMFPKSYVFNTIFKDNEDEWEIANDYLKGNKLAKETKEWLK